MRRILVVFALVASTLPEAAHANNLAGEWYGVIEAYENGEPRRKMTIGATCTWDELNRSIGHPAPCVLGRDKVTLTSGAGSKIELAGNASNLQGTFTLKSGESFRISMFRSTTEVPGWTDVRRNTEEVLCEQTVRYRIVAPSADVPASMRAFSGVWLGNWGNWMCGALVVQSVGKNGAVQTKYVLGRSPMTTYQGAVSDWPGTVENGIMVLRNDASGTRIEFRLTGSELKATRHQGPYISRGDFTRR